jgi:tetratricopeptide (TPR) repeat protein/transcriptional regulator with XRE-family HTH domain
VSETVATMLKRLRIMAGLSQEELAERAKLSAQAISALERGIRRRPHPNTLRALSGALKLPEADRRKLFALARSQPSPQPQARLRPAQLPLDVASFTGRNHELACLDAAAARHEPLAAVPVVVISGTPGVGKTALAVRWAHRRAASFPAGQLYADLRGFSPGGQPAAPAVVIRGFLGALGVAPQRIPAGTDAQAALYRSQLRGLRMLIVLDNALDAEQVRPLLPGAPGCMVVVTSRSTLTSLVAAEGAQSIALGVLTAEEARELAVQRLGPGRVASEPEAAEELIDLCAGLPLALTIAAAQVATWSARSLAQLAADLRHTLGRLDALSAGDPRTDIRTVFSWSYQHLSAPAARMFRLLGLHPGPDISLPAAASLAGVSRSQARASLASLTQAHLLTEHAPGRYAFHDLLRAYAVDQGRAGNEQERNDASCRMLAHYLHASNAAAKRMNPGQEPLEFRSCWMVAEPEELDSYEDALTWFGNECDVLVAVANQAAADDVQDNAWRIAWSLTGFLDIKGYWHALATVQHNVLASCRRNADLAGQAYANRGIARACGRLGLLDDALAHLRESRDLFERAGELLPEARTHIDLGFVLASKGLYQEAVASDEKALALFRAIDDKAGQAKALNGIGWNYSLQGDHHEAVTWCEQAVSLNREIGNLGEQGTSLDSLGFACHHLGDHRKAISCYEQALDLFRQLADRYAQSVVLTHLGDTWRASGSADNARNSWQAALAILDELQHPDAGQVRDKLTGCLPGRGPRNRPQERRRPARACPGRRHGLGVVARRQLLPFHISARAWALSVWPTATHWLTWVQDTLDRVAFGTGVRRTRHLLPARRRSPVAPLSGPGGSRSAQPLVPGTRLRGGAAKAGVARRRADSRSPRRSSSGSVRDKRRRRTPPQGRRRRTQAKEARGRRHGRPAGGPDSAGPLRALSPEPACRGTGDVVLRPPAPLAAAPAEPSTPHMRGSS